MTVRLWYIRETEAAYCYSKTDPKASGRDMNPVFIPKSLVEHRTKRGDEHMVTVPDWFADKEDL